ncbi:hypothetical protein [Amycolatopsis sp. H20-H5]|uniref:hypothetical protein n=1 Tax=Amycolatopsis sp. H20-H5 TaxID=3046309 RepID=UPI002DBE2CD5|nr:hypothetical protein [Amycolatopsis sp. H20-H5]MEC3974913.1 hypothetical protein [Amycolatopsis sp. H20-H5]
MTQPDRLFTSPFTSGVDYREHLVADEAFAAWRKDPTVAMVAVCGHAVDLLPTTSPGGRACIRCLRALTAAPEPGIDLGEVPRDVADLCALAGIPRQRARASHRRHGTLHRLLHGRLLHHRVAS